MIPKTLKPSFPQIKTFRYLFVGLVSVGLLGGCQFYRSGGRTQFESNAPGQVTNTNLSPQSRAETQAPLCWVQPADEPLWYQESGETYSIETHDSLLSNSNTDAIIEVCRENSSSIQAE